MIRFFQSLYLSQRLYIALAVLVALFIFGQFFFFVYAIAKVLLITTVAFIIVDMMLLYSTGKNAIVANRHVTERLSNGDDNEIKIQITNNFSYQAHLTIIDEIPAQFQIRDFAIYQTLNPAESKTIMYKLRPVERGEYHFGALNIFVRTVIGLVNRRLKFNFETNVAVYPSYIQMRKYELMAISDRLTEVGIKKVRRISQHAEFDQIREYVHGDDYRTLNWKATARRGRYMVNQYQDERSQHVYSIIDMGRTMKMPFEGMSLLDYAINASLIISNIAMYKHDKAGLITFTDKINSFIPAQRTGKQMLTILEMLYKQTTNFAESNLELLYITIRHNIKQRSLLLLYTNFEGFTSLNRQLRFLKRLAKNHLVVVIFFENTEIKALVTNSQTGEYKKATNIEQVYTRTIAEKFVYEKKLIVKELNKNGIHCILTEPQKLNVGVINKYLELKARGLI